VSAKEISDSHGISFELLAKVLGLLSKSKIIRSVQGVQGGYILQEKPESITLDKVIRSIEGNSTNIVECSHNHHDNIESTCACQTVNHCTIRHPMLIIQQKMDELFTSITIKDFLLNTSQIQSYEVELLF
jgi:Rrf2 family protein